MIYSEALWQEYAKGVDPLRQGEPTPHFMFITILLERNGEHWLTGKALITVGQQGNEPMVWVTWVNTVGETKVLSRRCETPEWAVWQGTLLERLKVVSELDLDGLEFTE